MERDLSGKTQESKTEPRIKPLPPLERTFLLGYSLQAQLQSPVEFLPDERHMRLKNPFKYRIPFSANRHLMKVVWDISQGKIATQAPFELRWKLFSDYATETYGVKNIPQKGPFIIAANHYPEGPLKGSWQTAAIADVVLRESNNRNYSFIIDKDKEKENNHPAKAKEDKTGKKSKLKDMFKKGQVKVLRNIAATLDYRNLDQMKEILAELRKGQEGDCIIGTFPTGEAELAFATPVKKEVGTLFEIAGKYDIPVLHVGVWHDAKRKTFILNFGEAVIYKKNPKDPNSKQTTAENVMRRIASLLLLEMKGIYG